MLVDLGSPDLRSGFGPRLQSISSALEDLIDRRQAARRRHREAVSAAQSDYLTQMRRADRVFENEAGEASRIRRRSIEADPDGENSAASLRADEAYFVKIRASETVHSEHCGKIAAVKEAAEAAAVEIRDREYRAAASWFLGVVRREIEEAVREALSSRQDG